MILPDASPVAQGHINIVGGRPVSYRNASKPERRVMDALTRVTELHVEEVCQPEHGVGVYRFGKVPTMHHHVVPRRNWEDGLDWTRQRSLIPVEARRVVRSEVNFEQVDGRIAHLGSLVTNTLQEFVNSSKL